jgi:hypothetical protein
MIDLSGLRLAAFATLVLRRKWTLAVLHDRSVGNKYIAKAIGGYAGVPVMRLQDYSSFFRREEFNAMTAAYDAVWQHLRTHRCTLTADQVRVLRKNLAQIILASACTGKRDVERLKEIALRGVSRRLLNRLGMLVPQLLPGALLVT